MEEVLDILADSINEQKSRISTLESKYKTLISDSNISAKDTAKSIAALNVELRLLVQDTIKSLPSVTDGRDGRDGRDFNESIARTISKELVDGYTGKAKVELESLSTKLMAEISKATSTDKLMAIAKNFPGPKGKDGKDGTNGKDVDMSKLEKYVLDQIKSIEKSEPEDNKTPKVEDVSIKDGKLIVKYCKGKDKILVLPKEDIVPHQFVGGSPTQSADVTKQMVTKWLAELDILNTKVDKVEGKALSANDFTDDYMNQIGINTVGISNAAQAIANLATAQAQILNDDVTVITTSNQELSFSTLINSTDTDVMTLDDAANTFTFYRNASYNFMSAIQVSSSTGSARTITFEVVDISDDSVLATQTAVLDVPSGSDLVINTVTLLTIGKNGFPSAPVTARVRVRASGTGYAINSFTSILASSSSYDVAVNQTGWKDNIQPFVKGAAGGAAPTLTTLANGARLYAFTNGDSVHVEFHIDHDIVPNASCYPHVHFISSAAMTAGQTVIWEFIYVKAKGHSQGQSLLAPRTTLTLTYVADGTEIAGEHIVLEHLTGFVLSEPDEIILAEYKKIGGTHGGTVYGIMGDLHYQSDREVTPNKAPNFYI